MKDLVKWKDTKDHLPLCISGMKGVGKTYLALDFAKAFYEQHLYLNFETDANLCMYFETKANHTNDSSFVELLSEYLHIPLEYLGNFLIILDELPCCMEAMILLKELLESSRIHFSILWTMSGAEEPIIKSLSHSLKLYPLQFDEFIIAGGLEWYAEVIKAHYLTMKSLPQIVHKDLLDYFEDFLIVGGMPSVVNEYLSMESMENVAEQQRCFLQSLLGDFYLRNLESDAIKMNQIVQVMCQQLMKKNRKFQYRFLRKGATHRIYAEAIRKLIQSSFAISCNKLGSESESEKNFRLYFPDTGLMNGRLQAEKTLVNVKDELTRKVLLENFLAQELHSNGYPLYFWESEAIAKIDFLISHKDGLVPIELKTEELHRNKSIGVFRQKEKIPYSIRISGKNFEYNNDIKHIPYYALFCI